MKTLQVDEFDAMKVKCDWKKMAAGMHNVPYRTFLKWNAAGGIVFSTIIVTLGYQFANSLSVLEKYLKYWAIGFLTLVVILVVIIKRNLEEKIVKE